MRDVREDSGFRNAPRRGGALRWLAFLLVPAAVLAAPAVHRALGGMGLSLDFAQTLRRLLLVGTVAALLIALRPWRDVPRDLWGLRGPASRPSLVVAGAGLAVAMLLAIVLLQAALGRIDWDEGRGWRKFWQRLPATLLGAVLIGVLEELFFRGWLLSRLRLRLRLGPAILVAAVLFALPHAFRGTAAPADLPATLEGAGEALAAWGRNLLDVADFGPRFVGLVLLAVLLSAALLRSGSLWLPIGIHAGAHLFLQQYSALTDRFPERDWMGSKWLYDGPPGWIAMAAVTLALWPRTRPASGADTMRGEPGDPR
jgi:membrane protease YdiL (CAAX protease family)